MENELQNNVDYGVLEKEVDELFTNEERKKLFIEVLTASVVETSSLMNLISLLLEFPEIMKDEESRKKIHDTLHGHKGNMLELENKIKKLGE